MTGFFVMARRCSTCIYRKDWMGTPIEKLEDQVRDRYVGFRGHRICHCQKRGEKACCRGFWDHHRDEFAAGQIAQRLGLVVFVEPTDEDWKRA
jgi:hypothetical protein